MKKLICLSLLVLLISCNHSSLNSPDLDRVCNVNDPLTELAWLEEKSQETNVIYSAIFKELDTRKNKVVEGFIFPSNLTRYYDCTGDVICVSGGYIDAPCISYEVLESQRIK